MGCIVNWPWEAKHADIWIFLPWNNENPQIPVYIKLSLYKILNHDNIFEEFMQIVENYIKQNS